MSSDAPAKPAPAKKVEKKPPKPPVKKAPLPPRRSIEDYDDFIEHDFDDDVDFD